MILVSLSEVRFGYRVSVAGLNFIACPGEGDHISNFSSKTAPWHYCVPLFFFKLDLTDRSKHEMCKLNQQLKPAAILLSHSSFHNNCKQGDYENQFFCFFVDFCSIKLQERKWRKFNAGISLSYFGPKLEDQGASAS
jgi:hypothetical protein